MIDYETVTAWQEAYCQRTCPPDKILFGKDMKAEEHLRSCFFCRERQLESGSKWSSLARKIQEYFPLPSPPEQLAAGQVWTIREKLAGWQEDQYYNAPQVMILEENNPVQVVQLYGDTALMGPDDVILGEFGFAETWNTFALAANDLGIYMGKVEEKRLTRTIKCIAKKRFTDIDENSILFQFRQLELEIGGYFSGRSIAGLLLDTPKNRILKMFPAAKDLKSTLEQKYPGCVIKDEHDHLLALADFQLPREYTGLAASTLENKHPVNWVTAKSNDISIVISWAKIHHHKRIDENVLISGTLAREVPKEHEFYAWWSTFSGARIAADETDLDPQSGEFDLEINNIPAMEYRHGSLILLILENK